LLVYHLPVACRNAERTFRHWVIFDSGSRIDGQNMWNVLTSWFWSKTEI